MLSRNFPSDGKERKRQIDTLKIFNDGVVEVTPNSEYEIEFSAGNHKMSLDVILGPDFPNEKPTIRINPMITHQWVPANTRDITGAPGLLNFTVHSDLGRVVQAIIREFERRPPPIINGAETDLMTTPTSASQDIDRNLTLPAGNSPSPGSSCLFPGLDNLSEDELQQMLNNPDSMDKFIETLPQTLEMERTVFDLMGNIENLANLNLSKEGEINTLRMDIESKTEKLNQLKNRFESLSNKHKKLTQCYTPQAIMESVRISVIQTDMEAEKIAQHFLNGVFDTETFLKNYEEKRSLGLVRRAKHERLSHQMKQFKKAG